MKSFVSAGLMCLLIGQSSHAVIYGTDDRREIYQTPWLSEIARAVAVAVPNIFLMKAQDGTYSVTDVTPLSENGICAGEPYASEPSIGVCTGFLISERYLVTAGHCLLPNGIVNNEPHAFCESFSWYFDYNLKRPAGDPVAHIPANQIYGCTRVIRAENLEHDGQPGNDFALIELDRPVDPAIHPLTLAPRKPAQGDYVYTVGHPAGLPAKFSGYARVLKHDQSHYFSVNLDTQGGNSGGPVFNTRGEVAGILVSGYQIDFVENGASCQRVNHCDDNGLNCEQTSVLPQLSNFVQNIETVVPYVPPATGAMMF